MKRLPLIIISLLTLLPLSAQQFLVGGSGTDQIAIIDIESEQIVWSHALQTGQECNSVELTKGGDIAYSYKQGAKLISREGETLFNYDALAPNEEVQSICTIDGGFLLGICGTPARIVELTHRGRVKRDITFDLGEDKVHGQFRQIRKSPKGSYIIPLMSRKMVVEVDKRGEITKKIPLEGTPFSVAVLRSGDYLTACGHSGIVYRIDNKSGELSHFTDNERLRSDSVHIGFGAEIIELKSGNLILTNWLGHRGDITQPALIEFSPAGDFVRGVKSNYLLSAIREF